MSEGRSEEATRLVFELIETAPRPQSYLAIALALETVGDERGARYWLRKGLERYPENAALRVRSAGFGEDEHRVNVYRRPDPDPGLPLPAEKPDLQSPAT